MFCCFTVKSFLNMSLPTAGMVIGWVYTVINLFQTAILLKADELIEFARNHADSMPGLIAAEGSSIGISILVTISLLQLVASILLIIGVNKANHLFLLPWMINNGIMLLVKFILGISLIAMAFSSDDTYNSPGFFGVIFILLILVLFSMVWNAIYSLFQSIRKTNDPELLDTVRLVENPASCRYELFKNPVKYI